MSHHARVNDALMRLVESVDTKFRINTDFWIAVRDEKRLGTRYGYRGSNQAIKRHKSRLQRLSYSGTDRLLTDDVIKDVWVNTASNVHNDGILDPEIEQSLVQNLQGVLQQYDR